MAIPETTLVNLQQVQQKLSEAYQQLHHLPIFKQLKQKYTTAFISYHQDLKQFNTMYENYMTEADQRLQNLYLLSSDNLSTDHLNDVINDAKSLDNERTENKTAQDRFKNSIERMDIVASLCFDKSFRQFRLKNQAYTEHGVAAVSFMYTEQGLQKLVTNQMADFYNHMNILRAAWKNPQIVKSAS